MSINEFEKWPSDKRKYDSNYLRIYGRECPRCHGTGNNACTVYMNGTHPPCHYCGGLGYIEKERKPNEQGGTL